MPLPTIADRVRAAREEADLSRQALADRAGVSYNAIVRLELSNHLPRAITLGRIAAALGISLDDLLSAHLDKPGAAS